MTTASKVVYAIAFQLGWFVCILTTNWLSFSYALIFLGIHFWFQRDKTTSLKMEVSWIAVVFIGGALLETISFSTGLLYHLSSETNQTSIQLPPPWLLNLWILFAIALRTCMSFVFIKPRLTYLIASIAIPLNYYAGAKLNAEVAVNTPYATSLALVSLMWILLLWLLNKIKRHYFEDMFNAR